MIIGTIMAVFMLVVARHYTGPPTLVLTLVVRLPGVPGSPRRTRRRLPGVPGSKKKKKFFFFFFFQNG